MGMLSPITPQEPSAVARPQAAVTALLVLLGLLFWLGVFCQLVFVVPRQALHHRLGSSLGLGPTSILLITIAPGSKAPIPRQEWKLRYFTIDSPHWHV
jgi:hypothetical protein